MAQMMTLGQIRQLLADQRPDLAHKTDRTDGCETWYWTHPDGRGERRVLRAKRLLNSAQLRWPVTNAPTCRFTGTEQQLLSGVDAEVAKAKEDFLTKTASRSRLVPARSDLSTDSGNETTSKKRRPAPPPIWLRGEACEPYVFETRNLGVDTSSTLLYLLQSFDADGTPWAKYVGKATNSARPWQHYRGKLDRYLDGGPDVYRSVHHGLCLASSKGHRIVATLVCNAPAEDVLLWESWLIKLIDSYGPGAQQLNDSQGIGTAGTPAPEAVLRALPLLEFKNPVESHEHLDWRVTCGRRTHL